MAEGETDPGSGKAKSAARFRLPRLRFTIRHLLTLIVVVGFALAWYNQQRQLREQAEEIRRLQFEHTRLTINNILRSEIPEAAKGRLLAPYVTIGAPPKRYGAPLGSIPRKNANTIRGTGDGCDLVVECAGGVVRAFGYFKPSRDPAGFVRGYEYCRVASDDPKSLPIGQPVSRLPTDKTLPEDLQ
jgi:hypothetical protein